VEGFHLARAAARFGDLRANYESVLPDLVEAYGTVRKQAGARFDAAAVARAELAWWVARRVPGRNSAEQIGSLMADEYAMLYEVPRPRVERAARLRAQAAAMRDVQADQPDWPAIDQLLRESYRSLHAGLAE
jgi:hypothetical protein